LAALETFVHIGVAPGLAFVSFDVEIPDSVLVERLGKPPRGWRDEPPGPASMRVGSDWLSRRGSVALIVPSVLVPQEMNVLLNPEHSDFPRLKVSRPRRFDFDLRMWK